MKKRLIQIFQALLGVVVLILTTLVAAGRLAWHTIRRGWKHGPKWLRRSIATILMLVPVGFAALIAYAYYDSEYGRSYCDRDLSDKITLHSFRDYKWRLYDRTIGTYVTGKLNWVSRAADNDSLAVYALSNQRGYINIKNGEIVIDAKQNNYSKAWIFSEGLAAVMKEDKIGFINAKNEVVIPFQFYYPDVCQWWNLGFVFHNGLCIAANADGDFGVIDKRGNWVIEPTYDEIWEPHDSGYRITVKDGKHGVLDPMCNVVYPAEYGYISIVHNGFVLTKGGKRWQVDFEGNIVRPFMFDNTYYLNYRLGYNEDGETLYALSDFMKYEIMNSCGIMNRITGEPITPAIYSDINMLSKELFEVQEYDSYDWYLLDTEGNIVSAE